MTRFITCIRMCPILLIAKTIASLNPCVDESYSDRHEEEFENHGISLNGLFHRMG